MRIVCSLVLLFFACALAGQAPIQGGPVGPVVKPPPSQAPSQQKPPAGKPGVEAKPDVGKADAVKPKDVAAPAKPAEKPAREQEEDEGDDEPATTPTQLPASADPSDVAAMQSAQAMIKAEARLRRLLKKGAIKGIDKILTFEEISGWPYQDGLKGMPESVKKMDGKTVLMTGFMLPIDEVEKIKEFLLVQSLWSCCYGQPPDINGIVRVVMKGDKRIDYKYDPIKVTGQFKVVASYEDGYCIDIYQLQADEVEVIK
ncbi:MAG: DUF3299 domain-containing protein [Planctomycetota bacterium]